MSLFSGNSSLICRGSLPWILAGWMLLTTLSGHAAPVIAGDYLMDLWTIEDGLPDSSVTAIAQTPEGYLWVGTFNGLARFDGVRFVTFDPFNTPALKHARVDGLFVDATGTLWINTRDGSMTSWRNGVFRHEWQGGQVSAVISQGHRTYFALLRGQLVCRTDDVDGTNDWELIPLNGLTIGNSFHQDNAGVLWYLTRDNAIGRLNGDTAQPLPAAGGLTGQNVRLLTADENGRIWAGTDKEIAVWSGGRFENQTPTNGEPQINVTNLFCTASNGGWGFADGRARKFVDRRWVVETEALHDWTGSFWGDVFAYDDHNGGIWFRHAGLGLCHIRADGLAQLFPSANGLPGNRMYCWFQDREENLWIGGVRGGLVRLHEKRFQILGAAEGLPAQAASTICEDGQGDLWIGTLGGGLIRWRNGTSASFNLPEGNYRGLFFSAFPDARNQLWLSAGREDLYQLDGEKIAPFSTNIHGIKVLFIDRKNRVWMGWNNGLSCWADGSLRNFGTNDGLARIDIRAIAEDARSHIWLGAGDGNLYEFDENTFITHRTSDDVAGQAVWSLLADSDGTLWVGTFRGGLLRFKDGTFTRYTMANGLPNNVICQILDDGLGNLWLGSHKGIFTVPKSALHELARGGIKMLPCVSYGPSDGLPTRECSGGYQPSAWRSRDGRLWFATIKGVVSIQPKEVTANLRPPQVVIEEMLVDGKPPGAGAAANGVDGMVRNGSAPALIHSDSAGLEIPPGPSQFFFRYTGLSFVAPDDIRFRYQLEGVDHEWVEAGTQRWAQYSHLKPGKYRFRVIACNSSEVWNQTGAAVMFRVLPHAWETWWFLSLMGAIMTGMLAMAIRAVVTRRLRRRLEKLEQQRAIERDRMRIAKDIHDDLGAGLTQILLQSALAQREPPQEIQSHLGQISGTASDLIRGMDEIVWAINPQNDTLDGLGTYLCKFAQEYLAATKVRCRLDLPEQLPHWSLSSETRHNVFLATKEALNNVLKHAQATEVRLQLSVQPHGFTVIIQDNGCGFRPGELAAALPAGGRIVSGYGLKNMVKRLESIDGLCEIISVPGNGTSVKLTVKLGSALTHNGE